jgi:O-antigen ligase
MQPMPSAPTADERLLGWFAPLAAWACYAQIGAKYIAYVGCALLCLNLLRQQGRASSAWQEPGVRWLVALLLVMALSSAWSVAPWDRVAAHLWTYSLMALLPLIVAACPPRTAERALAHFVAASAVVGLLFLLRSLNVLSPDPRALFWMATLEATGNQRVVTSLLLAIGAVLGLWLASRQLLLHWRVLATLAALMAAAGLVLQDRRTGMVVLPVMLFAWALSSQRGLLRKTAGLVAVVLVATLGWQASDTVRLRFAEGVSELRHYQSNDQVATSWGQRVRMLELTGQMVREKPLLGHGAGSWQTLWQARVTPQTALSVHSTPHNEFMLFTVQAGVLGLLLFMIWLGTMVVGAARSGPAGAGALMLWTAIAMSALFNAVFRDVRFALPLLLLVGLAGAVARSGRAATDRR